MLAARMLIGRAAADASQPLDRPTLVFVPSGSASRVTVIDGASNRVVSTLDVAGRPSHVLVSEPTGTMVVSFEGRQALQLVSLARPGERSILSLPLTPDAMVLSPDGYLVGLVDGARGSIAVVSLHQRKLLFELAIPGGPRHLAFSSDGSQLYVTAARAPELALVDIVQQSVISRATLGRPDATQTAASALTRTPDGRHGFVALRDSDSVLVLNLSTLEPVKRLQVGRLPARPWGTADGRLMLVPNEGDGSISIIDAQALVVRATVPAVRDVAAINTGWFESLAFVTSRTERRVAVLDLMGFARLGDIELPAAPGAGVVNDSGQKLFVSLAETDQLAIIDTQRHALVSLVSGAGGRPSSAVIARTNNYCH